MTQERKHWLTALSPGALLAYGGCCALAVTLMVVLTDDVTGLPARSLAFLIATGTIALALGGYRWLDGAKRRPRPLSKIIIRRTVIALGVVADRRGRFLIVEIVFRHRASHCILRIACKLKPRGALFATQDFLNIMRRLSAPASCT